MTEPLLSVLIDTYNHERYIEQAVVSAIEQDFPAADYEILVVDDGSTDRTTEIVRKFAQRVRLLTKKNSGQASAFNVAFPELRGEIVAFLDGDDWFAPGKLSAVMNALEQHPEAAAVGHGHYEFHEKTKEVRVSIPSEPKHLHLSTVEAAREAFHAWPFLLLGALTVRKTVLERIMPIPEALVFCADTPIQLASLAGGTFVLEKPLFYYRYHSANLRANDRENSMRMHRGLNMNELAIEMGLPLLAQLGVRPDSARALVYPAWTQLSRINLSIFGGSRLKTFRTEMRRFECDFDNPRLPYRLFKYLVVGAATLLLPPRRFYRMRDWYSRRDVQRIRERFVTSSTEERRVVNR